MKKTILIVMAVILSNSFLTLNAATIKNRLKNRITVNLSGGRKIVLSPNGTASIPDSELSSPSLQNLIKRGSITIVSDREKGKDPEKSDKKEKKRLKIKK